MNRVHILRETVKKLTPMIAGRGLRVTQFGAKAYVETHKATGKIIRVNIPHIADDADEALCLAIQGFIDHEVGHVLDTDFGIHKNSDRHAAKIAASRNLSVKAAQERLHDLWNICEDPFVERCMAQRFKGSGHNVEKLHQVFLEKISKPAFDRAKAPADQFGILLVPLIRSWAGQDIFKRYIADNGFDAHPMVAAFDKAVGPELKKKLLKARTSADNLAVAKAFFDILHPEPPPQPPAPPPPAESSDEAGESDDSEKGEKSDGKGSNQNKPEDDEDQGSGGEQEQQDDEGAAGDQDQAEQDPADQDADDAGDSEDEDNGAQGEKAETDQDNDDQGAGGDADDQEDDEGDAPDAKDGKSRSEEDDDDAAENDDGAKDQPDVAEDKDDAGQDGDEAGDGDDADQGDDAAGDGSDEGEGTSQGDDDADAESKDGVEGDKAGDTEDGDGEPSKAQSSGDDENGGDGDTEVKEADAGTHDTLKAPEPQPFAEIEIKELGKHLSEAIEYLITNDATREIRDADYRVFTTEWDVIEKFPVPANMDPSHVARLEEKTLHMVGPMQKEIERMMAARSQIVKVPGYRSGRLHSGSLHRLRVNDDRVFRRIEVNKTKETAVSLLIDNSGSMWGEKLECAMAAGFALSQTLERINIKHEVMGFTTSMPENKEHRMLREEAQRIGVPFSRECTIYMPIFKDFNERLTPEVKRRFAIAPSSVPAHSNIDGECVRIAANRLAQRPEVRKVLIVLSDGQPAGYGIAAEIYADLHRAVAQAEALKIETIGLGIMDASVKTFYPKHAVLKKLTDLPGAVMGELKRILVAA